MGEGHAYLGIKCNRSDLMCFHKIALGKIAGQIPDFFKTKQNKRPKLSSNQANVYCVMVIGIFLSSGIVDNSKFYGKTALVESL